MPIDWVASTNHVNIKLVFTPKALHSKAQGRRASGAPWVDQPRGIQTPTGFYKCGMPRTNRSCDTNIAMHVGRLSNPVGVTVSPCNAYPGYAACREPRAMECNAFGVGAIGHIVRLRNDGPSGTPSDASGHGVGSPIDWVASTNHVNIKLVFTPKALHSKAQGRRASGAPWVDHAARNPNPNGVLQMRDAAYQSFVRHEYRHARRAIVQPRWGNRIAVHRVPGVRGVAANPGLWNVTPSA